MGVLRLRLREEREGEGEWNEGVTQLYIRSVIIQ